jgi:hypothetical protein
MTSCTPLSKTSPKPGNIASEMYFQRIAKPNTGLHDCKVCVPHHDPCVLPVIALVKTS